MKENNRIIVVAALAVWFIIGGCAYADGLFGTLGKALDSTIQGVGEIVSEPFKEEKEPTKATAKKQKSAPPKKTIKRYSLTIDSDPGDAKIRILNIGPKYKDGILLKKGKYHVEIQQKGYKTYRQWIALAENTTLNIKLEKRIDNTQKYIRFIRETEYAIPALPIDALKTDEFRRFIIGSLFSSKTLIKARLEKMDSDFKKKKFENNFDKRRALKALEKQKEDLIQKTAQKYEKKINTPVFYADFYTPVHDKDETIGFRHMEVVDWNGKRHLFNLNTMYRGNDLALLHKGNRGFLSVYANNASPKSYLRLTMDEKEKFYLGAPKYSGPNKKQSKNREAKGRMFYSISDKTNSYIKLHPEFFELGPYKGRYKNFKPWHRKDRDYSDRESYSLISEENKN